MDIYIEQIDRIVHEQKKLLEDYTQEYNISYGGSKGDHLICCRNHGKDNYYCAYHDEGKYTRRSINKRPDEINALARKEYLRVAIEALGNNVDVLGSTCQSLIDLDFDTIKSQMERAYRGLPEDFFFANGTGRSGMLSDRDEDRIKRHIDWANEPYEKSTFNPEGRRFMTSAGFRVRSKSEQHIVEQLVNYGVQFRYEQVIHINDKDYSADFTFRDSNMELFYWEHAGMMDVPKYADGHHRKMKAFNDIGIVPWKNLIITYDIDGVINVPMIKSIIENEVIPRM